MTEKQKKACTTILKKIKNYNLIMIEQVKQLFKISDEKLENHINTKLKRTFEQFAIPYSIGDFT